MSEHYAYVACTCWRDGKTTVPPAEVEFRFDAYGNLRSPAGEMVEDWSDEMYEWATDTACPHRHMRLVEEIFVPAYEPDPRLVDELVTGRYEHLRQVLDQASAYSYRGVIAPAAIAASAKAEIDALSQVRVGPDTRVLVDRGGREPIEAIDLHGFPNEEGPIGLGVRDHYGAPTDHLLEVGVDGLDLLVRTMTAEPVELLRAARLGQHVADDAEVVKAFQYLYAESTFTNLDSGESAAGYARPVTYMKFASVADCELLWDKVEELTVAVRPLVMTDLGWYLPRLQALLEASVVTGNPVVMYYSGNSLGYD
ncbi:hypothetical protein ABIE44_003031 [Marmoricola sp. OAE513]|uniref:hypothetical protein n=1 Tax=Marmoricola sp. OAE513 TaxID=2817894 RepID=UPI001AE107E2